MAKTVKVIMKQRSDTSANWAATDPVLLAGELGYSTDDNIVKIGDGTKKWSQLDSLVYTQTVSDYVGDVIKPGDTLFGGTATTTFND